MASTEPILTISVAGKLIGLHPRTLMLYEQALIFKPHRTATNRRFYSLEDIEKLQFIKYLTHTEGINLKGVKYLLEALIQADKHGINLQKLLFPSYSAQSPI